MLSEAVVQMVFLDRQACDGTAVNEVFFHDFGDVVFRERSVDGVARIDDHDRALVAHAQAPGQADGHPVGQAVFVQLLAQQGGELSRSLVDAARPVANDDSVRRSHSAIPF